MACFRCWLLLLIAWVISAAGQPALVEIKRSAEGGNPEAQKRLAQSYASSFRFAEAEYWYKKAAPAGDPEVLLALAWLYSGGKPKMSGSAPVLANPSDAMDLYHLAAAQGHKRAQHDLAIQYYNGTIVPRNPSRAYQLFRLSDYITGKPYLDRLILEMSTAEVQQAETEVKAFKAKPFRQALSELVKSKLELQGIFSNGQKTLAIVNSRTVKPGGSFAMEVAGIPVMITCKEITRDSVRVTFPGGDVRLKLESAP